MSLWFIFKYFSASRVDQMWWNMWNVAYPAYGRSAHLRDPGHRRDLSRPLGPRMTSDGLEMINRALETTAIWERPTQAEPRFHRHLESPRRAVTSRHVISHVNQSHLSCDRPRKSIADVLRSVILKPAQSHNCVTSHAKIFKALLFLEQFHFYLCGLPKMK